MGKNYWLVSGDLYFVHKEYLLEVQEKFQNVLKDHLVRKETLNERKPADLFLPWDLKSNKITHEDEYNNKYSKIENFYVGDKVLVSNIEYFDIAYDECTTNRTYLYHVKKGFGQTTRDVCSQLNNAAELLTSMRTTNKSNQNEVSKVQSVLKKAFNMEEARCKSLLGIGSTNRELVFVLELLPNTKPHVDLKKPSEFISVNDRKLNRTLKLEKDLITTLSKDGIRDFIEKNEQFKGILISEFGQSCDIVGRLIRKLEEGKFFRRKGEELKVTAKLIYMKSISVFEELFPESHQKVKLCNYVMLMLTDYVTYFHSLGAKLEIIRCRDFLHTKLSDLKACFKIDEILVEVAAEDISETSGNVKQKQSRNGRKRKSSGTPKKQNNAISIEDANTESIDDLPDTQFQEDGLDGRMNEANHQIPLEEIVNESETANRNMKRSPQKKRKSNDSSECSAKRRK